MFSPLLDHMHRLAPVLPVGPDRRSLPRSVGEAFGSTPLGATNPSVRQQELGQDADMAWALLPRHTTSDAVAATGDRTHRLRRAAASMLPAGNERELEEALRHFVLLTLPPETELCRRGQPSECMYILLQGKLRVEAVVDEVRQRHPALACTPLLTVRALFTGPGALRCLRAAEVQHPS